MEEDEGADGDDDDIVIDTELAGGRGRDEGAGVTPIIQ